MAMYDKEVRLIPSGQDGSAQQALEAPHDLLQMCVQRWRASFGRWSRPTTAFELKS